MGTRSLTFIYDDGQVLVNMYRQFDGYPSGHGTELAAFLASGKMVNGFSRTEERQFNGMCCLAAQMVAHFKKGVGGFYLMAPGTSDHGQEFEYHVREGDAGLGIEVTDGTDTLFIGSLDEFAAWCKTTEEM